jgi:hypothetical protein
MPISAEQRPARTRSLPSASRDSRHARALSTILAAWASPVPVVAGVDAAHDDRCPRSLRLRGHRVDGCANTLVNDASKPQGNDVHRARQRSRPTEGDRPQARWEGDGLEAHTPDDGLAGCVRRKRNARERRADSRTTHRFDEREERGREGDHRPQRRNSVDLGRAQPGRLDHHQLQIRLATPIHHNGGSC